MSCAQIKNMGLSGVRKDRRSLNARWIKNLDPGHESGNLPIALQSPLIYRGMVFIGSNKGSMNAYSLEDGRTIWSVKEKGNYHSMPVAYKNNVIYGNALGRLYSRNIRSGELKFAVDLDAAVESRPVVYRGRLFVHTRNHKIFSLDAETGKILWAYKRSVPYLTTLQRVSRPLVVKNRLYVGFADGVVASFSVDDGMLLWETKVAEGMKFVDVDSEPLLMGKNLVITSLSDSITILNVRNGLIKRKVPYAASRAPYLYKGGVLVGTSDGRIVHFNKNFRVIREVQVGQDSISNIGEWNNSIVVTTVDGHLLSLDKTTLKVKESNFFGHVSSAIFGHLSIEDGAMATMSSRNRLYVF